MVADDRKMGDLHSTLGGGELKKVDTGEEVDMRRTRTETSKRRESRDAQAESYEEARKGVREKEKEL